MSNDCQYCHLPGGDHPACVDHACRSIGETRVVDPKTGGEKGSKLARFGLIPWDALWALAEHYGRGSRKYADHNWLRGYKYSLSFDALMRHAQAWWGGEEMDAETGSSHMIAVAWHAFALFVFRKRGLGTDDRFRVPADSASATSSPPATETVGHSAPIRRG